jgi:F420-dependent oxidoreductase-like protein
MELCLMIEGQEGIAWPQWVALANACERHSIPALVRSDHYLNLDGHEERGSLEAWGTLTALAAVTSTLRLGALVTPVTVRHPSVLAKLVATADQISGGRVELGLGSGWHEGEHDAYGFAFPPLRVRMDMLEEQLQVLLGTWADGSFSFDGAHYRLRELKAQPKPVQRPHPWLIVGGAAGPRSLRLAARYADEYNTDFTTIDEARGQVARITQACEGEARNPLHISLMANVVLGADERDLARRAQRAGSAEGVDGVQLVRDPPPFWIVGTLQRGLEQFAALRAVGVNRVICRYVVPEDLDGVAIIGEAASRIALA